jgi:hypothetical protein
MGPPVYCTGSPQKEVERGNSLFFGQRPDGVPGAKILLRFESLLAEKICGRTINDHELWKRILLFSFLCFRVNIHQSRKDIWIASCGDIRRSVVHSR